MALLRIAVRNVIRHGGQQSLAPPVHSVSPSAPPSASPSASPRVAPAPVDKVCALKRAGAVETRVLPRIEGRQGACWGEQSWRWRLRASGIGISRSSSVWSSVGNRELLPLDRVEAVSCEDLRGGSIEGPGACSGAHGMEQLVV